MTKKRTISVTAMSVNEAIKMAGEYRTKEAARGGSIGGSLNGGWPGRIAVPEVPSVWGKRE